MNCASTANVAECLKHLLVAMLPQGPELIDTLKAMVSPTERDDLSDNDDDDDGDDGDDLSD